MSFSLHEGEALGIAGESGSGKSVTCLSILRLVPQPAGRIVGGKVLFQGEDLLAKPEKEMRLWRGKRVAMVLQDPLMSLNPVFTIGNQVSETFRLDDNKCSYPKIVKRVIEILRRVRIPSAEQRLKDYPFQFSGGMRQRTVAAIALARQPRLLIADEPTTSLDVTVQDQFLRLLKNIQIQNNMGLILVTHDLAIVAENCDRVAVMYAGRIVESGDVESVYKNPAHPYTEALMRALPRLGRRSKRLYQIDGEPPNLLRLPAGCSFWPRCKKAKEICREQYPPTTSLNENRDVACWLLSEGSVKK